MARSVDRTGGVGSGVKAVVATGFVVAMAVLALVIARARPTSEPFDPRSGRADGARGLVVTLTRAGADVVDSRTVPGVQRADLTRLLILEDRLDDAQRSQVLDFVDAGGVVVVADPTSTLHGGSDLDGGAVEVVAPEAGPFGLDERRPPEVEANVDRGDCTVEALDDLRGIFVPAGVLFPVGPSEPQCFTDGGRGMDGRSFVIVRRLGAGVVVGLGDNEPFVNQHLRKADNAGLIVSLLAPTDEARVAIVVGRGVSANVASVGSGDDTLVDLVPTWVWMSLVTAGVAFVVFAISRSTREGRILEEPAATPIAGSELVSATGNLMQRAGHAGRAGELVLSQLRRDLCRVHGVQFSAPLGELDRAVAAHSDVGVGETEHLLRTVVVDPAELAALAADVARFRRRVADDGSTTTDTTAFERTPS